MKFINFLIILLFLIGISFEDEEPEEDWLSPCEETLNPTSLEDCTGKSTEYVDETCCYMKAIQYGEESIECAEVIRDDIRTKELINKTVEKIKAGVYWERYNETYESVSIFRCSGNYILIQIIFLILLYFIFYI